LVRVQQETEHLYKTYWYTEDEDHIECCFLYLIGLWRQIGAAYGTRYVCDCYSCHCCL